MEALREVGVSFDSEIADLKALAYVKKGDVRSALVPLNEIVANGHATFHTYYRLAEYHRMLGEYSQTYRYHRLAHAKVGWSESLSHGYTFTHDYFSPAIPHWKHRFTETITASPLNALEIGSWQGGSATWLLDKVISHRGGRLTCVDPFIGSSEHIGIIGDLGNNLERIFDDNVMRTGHGSYVRKLVGFSQQILPSLAGEEFDFIYIDGAHEAKFVIQDAMLCWNLLKKGAFMLFDDLNFTFLNNPEQNTFRATDFFLSVFSDDLEILEKHHQLLIRRI
jgi:predicted O-methyltransferase YrrM